MSGISAPNICAQKPKQTGDVTVRASVLLKFDRSPNHWSVCPCRFEAVGMFWPATGPCTFSSPSAVDRGGTSPADQRAGKYMYTDNSSTGVKGRGRWIRVTYPHGGKDMQGFVKRVLKRGKRLPSFDVRQRVNSFTTTATIGHSNYFTLNTLPESSNAGFHGLDSGRCPEEYKLPMGPAGSIW